MPGKDGLAYLDLGAGTEGRKRSPGTTNVPRILLGTFSAFSLLNLCSKPKGPYDSFIVKYEV